MQNEANLVSNIRDGELLDEEVVEIEDDSGDENVGVVTLRVGLSVDADDDDADNDDGDGDDDDDEELIELKPALAAPEATTTSAEARVDKPESNTSLDNSRVM
jgi:hypothetical protein